MRKLFRDLRQKEAIKILRGKYAHINMTLVILSHTHTESKRVSNNVQ